MSFNDYTLDPDGDVSLILTDQDGGSKLDNTCMNVENDTSRREIRVRCSSKHLTLASPVFKAMLSRNFKESASLRFLGTLELPLPDDDPDALLILLNVIHVQTEKIPLEVDLHMLTRISVLVDKYQLQRAVVILSRIWIDPLKAKIPQSWTEDLRQWIFISRLFQYPAEFKFATRIAEQQSEFRIDESGEIDLPIPCSIVDTIDQHRQEALSQIITALRSALEKYQGPDRTCTKRCDSTVLGSLTLAMKSMQVLIPLEAPYSKLSFRRLCRHIREMEIFRDDECDYKEARDRPCQNISDRNGYGFRPIKVTVDMGILIKKLDAKLCGLDLDITNSE